MRLFDFFRLDYCINGNPYRLLSDFEGFTKTFIRKVNVPGSISVIGATAGALVPISLGDEMLLNDA